MGKLINSRLNNSVGREASCLVAPTLSTNREMGLVNGSESVYGTKQGECQKEKGKISRDFIILLY